MKYNELKNGYKLSMLGYGCMRFPVLENGEIDESKAGALLINAYENGINYYDIGHMYHNGKAEEFVGNTMSQLDRSTFYYATKMPIWMCSTLEDAKKIISKQLSDLKTDYIDFYLLHSVTESNYEKANKLGITDYLFELKEKGVFKNVGFSFHDSYEVFENVIKDKVWDFCQLQLNYMDMDAQAGIKGYNLCKALGIPVFVMEPVRGGQLASLPPDIEAVLKQADPAASVASWALRFIGSFENVKIVLSGMSNISQLSDNINTFSDFKPLSVNEKELMENVKNMIKQRININCTACRYCMPCPAGVNIPYNFKIWNEYKMYQNKAASVGSWRYWMDSAQKAINCIKCGKCELVCPQNLHIMSSLEKLQKEMDSLS